jgi:alpha-aminoadipate carrier protein LysW
MRTCVYTSSRNEDGLMVAECPECGAEVPIPGAVIGEIVHCQECGSELEVISLEPPTLNLAPSEEEDWGE